MEKIISCCGLNCVGCDARIATVTNDNALRSKTAAAWRTQYNAVNITAEMINCTGCREPGAKFDHCNHCEIRNCASSKSYNTCAECEKLEHCPILENVHQYVPEALENLKGLN
jgi:hypothetical protein